jgi:site-specific DNA-methyltransferase (adenine-specific)
MSRTDQSEGAVEEILTSSGARLKLHMEDCLEGFGHRLEPASISVVVTSPPYNLGVAYGTYDDAIPREEYLEWLERWAQMLSSFLHPEGSIFLNIGSRPSDPWGPFEVIQRLRPHFSLQNVIHWVKSIYIDHSSYGQRYQLNVGHYKPVNSPRFLNDNHEYIFHLTHNGRVSLDRLAVGVPYKDGTNVGRWGRAGSGLRCRGNCWYVPYPTIKRRDRDRPHPASFPPLLAEMCIRLHGLSRVRLVLDPFMGIGSTALASRNLGVDFVGFEIDPQYFEVAARRLRTEQGQFSFFAAEGSTDQSTTGDDKEGVWDDD